MDAYEELDEILKADIARFSKFEANPETSPDLWGVEGVEGKRSYYKKYNKGISTGLLVLRPSIDSKDFDAFRKANQILHFERQASLQLGQGKSAETSAYVEGLGRVLDRISEVQASVGFDRKVDQAEMSSLPRI